MASNDKTPGFDGHVAVFTRVGAGAEDGQPIGQVRVQVKGLTGDAASNRKVSFPDTKFFEAIRRTGEETPTLLIGVDLERHCAYWKHITVALIDGLKGMTVHLDEPQVMAAGESSFVDAWEEIIARHKEAVRAGQELILSNTVLKEIAKATHDLTGPELAAVQRFLHKLNSMLDNQFGVIRTRFFGECHQLGLAYYEFLPQRVTYTLFRIPLGVGDAPIKQLKTAEWEKVGPHTSNLTTHVGNPFVEDAEDLALATLEDLAVGLPEDFALLVDHSVDFASEFVDCAARHLHYCLGLPEAGSLRVSDLLQRMRTYFPLWMMYALQALLERGVNGITTMERAAVRDVGGNPLYFDPDHFYMQMSADVRGLVVAQVDAHLKAGRAIPPIGPLGHRIYPLRVVMDCLQSLKDRGVEEIKSPLPARTPRATAQWSWTQAQWLEFGRAFLPLAFEDYRAFVRRNLPQIENEILRESGHDSSCLYVISYRESHPFGRGLSVEEFALQRKDGLTGPPKVIVQEAEGRTQGEGIRNADAVTLDGVEYVVHRWSSSFLGVSDLHGPALSMHHMEEVKRALEGWFRKARGKR